MEEKKTILDVKHLRVDFTTDQGTVQAVRDVSFSVKEGEILALSVSQDQENQLRCISYGPLAQNGSINEGEIVFNGESIARKDFPDNRSYEKKMREIRGNTMAMIFQDPMTFLNPVLTIGKQIRETLLNHNPKMTKKEANERAIELMRQVGIPAPEKRINQYPFEFSGGMRQRIVIAIALANKPKLIIAGASAYSRTIDFEFMSKVAKEVGAYFMVDMAHIAGLVAAGVHPSPFPYADIVTTTTHKTLRGPRGGVIMCKKEFAADIDRAVFPGMQGGPLMHIIAAKAQCFYEVQQPEFKDYAKQIIKNAKAMEKVFKEEGFRLVAGGTDNHLLLVDVKASCGISGKKAQRLLDEINITANKNAIPFDTEKPFKASGIRIGTPAMTTKGFKEEDFEEVARIIAYRLKNEETDEIKEECLKRVAKLTEKVTMYSNIKYI